MRRKFLTCLVIISIGSRSAFADGVLPGTLTLAQAQQLALRNNADLRIAGAQAEAALAQLVSVREFPNPMAGYSVGKINVDRRSNATAEGNSYWSRSYDSIFTFSQFIELRKRGVRRASAEAAVRSADAMRDDSRRLLLQSVDQLYLSALEAREEVRVLTESATSLRREAGIAALRFHAGDIAASDQVQIEMAATQLELSATTARATARSIQIALEKILGLNDVRGETILADSIDSIVIPSAIAQTTVGSRPDLVAAEATLAKSEADLTLQRRGAIPDLTVALQYEHQPPDQPNTMGLAVSLPLPLWNRNTGSILAARAARREAEAQLDKVRTQISSEITSARVVYDEAQARAEACEKDLRQKSAAIAQAVRYAYEKGGAALVELLAAERNDNDIRLATARARADAVTAAFVLAAVLNQIDPASSSSALH